MPVTYEVYSDPSSRHFSDPLVSLPTMEAAVQFVIKMDYPGNYYIVKVFGDSDLVWFDTIEEEQRHRDGWERMRQAIEKHRVEKEWKIE